jgi:hypothetical protein
MTNEEEIAQLKIDIEELKRLLYKDNFSNLEIFRKKVEFKANVDLDNINKITKTGGTAPIADGSTIVNIGALGGSITITTKNGIITAIS